MKRISHDCYVHIKNIKGLPKPVQAAASKALHCICAWVAAGHAVSMPDVLKISDYPDTGEHPGSRVASFMWCDDFDGNPEPAITMAATVWVEPKTSAMEVSAVRRYGKENKPVYHGKEMMVGSRYRGFDLAQAAARRKEYQSWGKKLPGYSVPWKEMLALHGMSDGNRPNSEAPPIKRLLQAMTAAYRDVLAGSEGDASAGEVYARLYHEVETITKGWSISEREL